MKYILHLLTFCGFLPILAAAADRLNQATKRDVNDYRLGCIGARAVPSL